MTIEQKQCLLTFLGFDTGGVDGIWGAKSRNATKQCQEYLSVPVDGIWGPQTETAVLEAVYTWDNVQKPEPETNDPTDLKPLFDNIKYWSPDEFRCRCGEYHAPYCNGFPVLPNRKLLELADDVREHFGRPGHRTSGIRCVQHNADSDGAANSRHMCGKALDFWIEGHTAGQVLAYVKTLPGVRYAYAINDTCVHMDVE